jgi:hypothetical protein
MLANISDAMTSEMLLFIEDTDLKQTESQIVYRRIPVASLSGVG